jgi:hypothetical protein
MTLNPSDASSATATAAPEGQGYDTRSILFLPTLMTVVATVVMLQSQADYCSSLAHCLG